MSDVPRSSAGFAGATIPGGRFRKTGSGNTPTGYTCTFSVTIKAAKPARVKKSTAAPATA
jgi:hypothetical protein